MSRLPITLTVAELIEILEDLDQPDAYVYFSTSYGDRGDTPQLLPIGDLRKPDGIERSAYSTSGWAVIWDNATQQERSDAEESVVLTGGVR